MCRPVELIEQTVPRALAFVICHGCHDTADGVLPILQVVVDGFADSLQDGASGIHLAKNLDAVDVQGNDVVCLGTCSRGLGRWISCFGT